MFPILAYYVPPSYLVEFDGFTTRGQSCLECSTKFLAVLLTLASNIHGAPRKCLCASATNASYSRLIRPRCYHTTATCINSRYSKQTPVFPPNRSFILIHLEVQTALPERLQSALAVPPSHLGYSTEVFFLLSNDLLLKRVILITSHSKLVQFKLLV